MTLVVRDLDLHLVDVVLEVTFFACAVGEDHTSVPVLDSADPLTLITTAISPVHLSVAFALVILVLSFVNVTRGPGELAEPALTIVYIIALITV